MSMRIIKNEKFEGERPLFESHNLRLENVTIGEGESALKECSNIEAVECVFAGKYPLWHVDGSHIEKCQFHPESRSAIWYSNDMVMVDCNIDAPKMFREMNNLKLKNVTINDADETFWNINGLDATNLTLHDGTYPFMGSQNIKIEKLVSDSKYVFQYVKNVEIHHAKITTKDAFWETENVTIYDSELNGEYLAWHSKNMTLIRCHITGEQPLCYAHNLTLIDCTFGADCDRAFEYSTVDAQIIGRITNIKNPTSGRIVADEIGSVTINKNIKQPADCVIETRK